MNTLSLGFFYVCGMAWCLTECCIKAVAGDPMPAILFLVAFTVIFAILGCLNTSEKVTNFVSSLAAIGLAAALFVFSLQTGGLVGALKTAFAVAFVIGAIVSILPAKSAAAAEKAR